MKKIIHHADLLILGGGVGGTVGAIAAAPTATNRRVSTNSERDNGTADPK